MYDKMSKKMHNMWYNILLSYADTVTFYIYNLKYLHIK